MNNSSNTNILTEAPIFGGTVYSQELDGWCISWEADTRYRFWCRQVNPALKNQKDLLIVMFNPGSLVAEGLKLNSDTCLRILRRVFNDLPFNCLVTNLFDYASANSFELFRNWNERDKYNNRLIYDSLDMDRVHGYLFAYGDYENSDIEEQIKQDIKHRIMYVKGKLNGLKEIPYCRNMSGTPKHTINWQRENLIPKIRYSILNSM